MRAPLTAAPRQFPWRHALAMLALAVLPGTALPQSPAPASEKSEPAPSARTQDITIEALQGAQISGAANYVGRFRTPIGESTSNIVWKYQIKIGPGLNAAISTTRNVHWRGKDGPQSASLSRSAKGTIGVPRQSDDGAALWLLDGNTLVLLRVFEVGGVALRITLARADGKWSCSATAPMAKEVGAGNSKTKAAVGGKVEMLSIKQTSANCHIGKV